MRKMRVTPPLLQQLLWLWVCLLPTSVVQAQLGLVEELLDASGYFSLLPSDAWNKANVTVPDPFLTQGQPTCGLGVNADTEACNAFIELADNTSVLRDTSDCDCYNFCLGIMTECRPYGEEWTRSTALQLCPTESVMIGCERDYNESTRQKLNPKSAANPCPRGYFCSADKQISCDLLRQIPIQAGFGDVHAGLYCPGRPDRYENNYDLCDRGFYCPNATAKFPCPRGYYCPVKTAVPEIHCPHCQEGALTLGRNLWGYVLVLVLCALVLLLVTWESVQRYNKRLKERIGDLQKRNARPQQQQPPSQREVIEELKITLQEIDRRLSAHFESRMRGSWDEDGEVEVKVGGLPTESDLRMSSVYVENRESNEKVQFSPGLLFDQMDTESTGELSYEELNKVLELKPAQYIAFRYRMNAAAGVLEDHERVARSVFAKNFLRVLSATRHVEPTPTDAARLFDEMDCQSNEEAKCEIRTIQFYYSKTLREFLNDVQISMLRKRFKEVKEGRDTADEAAGDEEEANEEEAKPTSTRNVKYSKLERGGGARKSMLFASISKDQHDVAITRDEFVSLYPRLLEEVLTAYRMEAKKASGTGGVDITFKNLCLNIKVKDKEVTIVNKVTGRLVAGTMTALMGGSGAGKTSLLNALCGRAFYGKVTGDILINGHAEVMGQPASIEDFSSVVGFVPQDDIVYAELTVRENFIFSGKFQLPQGTPLREIEDLADATMASLGLSRVMHSMVGDVRRRGVSGGEKKRVNIGLELMSRPKILFLDEPTSGLDSNSALLVMQSLKNLVDQQGVTVCSVIHQPRKFIFELFDSLVLLGVGGNLVYHGKVTSAEQYFRKLNYVLPAGESIADWLIDISSGRLEPTPAGDDDHKQKLVKLQSSPRASDFTDESASQHPESMHAADDGEMQGTSNLLPSMEEREKHRREDLYVSWQNHFENLSAKKRASYEAPTPFELPWSKPKPAFLSQMWYQVQRLWILKNRNWLTGLVDTCIIVGAVILVSLFGGVAQPTTQDSMQSLTYESIAEPHSIEALVREFPKLFSYAIVGNQRDTLAYVQQIGVLFCVLLCLTATKILTEKRSEFFRESGSGYNIDSYFCAVNVVATFEHSIQAFLASLMALWLRNTLAAWYSYCIHFLALAWISVSWALLIPLIVPPQNVVLVTGFYITLFCLLFSGAIAPVTYANIYANEGTALFSGFFAPNRFFQEALCVAESKCLPVQSGFTDFGTNFVGPAQQTASFSIVGQGLNDWTTVTTKGCNGWYWGVWPSIAVGLAIRFLAGGMIHTSDRAKQARKPLLKVMKKSGAAIFQGFVYMIVLFGLAVLAGWLMLRKDSSEGSLPSASSGTASELTAAKIPLLVTASCAAMVCSNLFW